MLNKRSNPTSLKSVCKTMSRLFGFILSVYGSIRLNVNDALIGQLGHVVPRIQ